jgi:single-strand DNA-binding protein
LRPSYNRHAGSNDTAIAVNFRRQWADENFALERVCRYVSRLLPDHGFGASPTPGGACSSASHLAPLPGLGSAQNNSANHGQEGRANFSRAPPRKQTSGTWEPGPFAWLGSVRPDQQRENSTNGDTFMYQNKVTLIGFLGSNPEARTNNPDFSVTTLSLATKSSYKKDNKYISHTEWHRCVVFGKLSEFAKTLTKGAHIQVEGELRSREYTSKKTDSKQRVWEIRVASILKLDRAEKAAPEDQEQEKDQEHDESSPEEAAA